MINFMITLILGIVIGYWAYPLYMTIKLYRIKKRIEQIERDFMEMKNDLYGTQWNEDNL
jgi:biopolymer transport protein ExbB/TolQ